MEKKIKFKILKVMKLTFKIIFSQLLLCITFDDRFWKIVNFKQHFATTYRPLTPGDLGEDTSCIFGDPRAAVGYFLGGYLPPRKHLKDPYYYIKQKITHIIISIITYNM